MEHVLEDVVETIKNARINNRGVTLLIGAGCSVKAGIPLAQGFVDIIKQDYERAYERAKEKNYPSCMEELSYGERQELIGRYIDKANVNWAHIAIAQLIKCGYVGRVLTTNFDPLIIKACSLVTEFPAVYDIASSEQFRPAVIPNKAVLYLHGQRTGFKMLSTQKECQELAERLSPVFDEASHGRTWIVAGYSGINDPVFDRLVEIPRFDHRLYWIGYKDEEPKKHITDNLLIEGKDAHFIPGYDADDFFVTLAQKLQCFPPEFISKPFSHLDNLLGMVTPYTLPGQEGTISDEAGKLIKRAISRYEEELPSKILKAQSHLMGGEYEETIATINEGLEGKPPELVDLESWAYLMQGSALADQAHAKSGAEADALFSQAYEKYQAALEIKPDKHEALNNWGNALTDQARTKSGAEADNLFSQAYEKYQTALKIKPDGHGILYNWGSGLADQARAKSGAEADALFSQAYEKYQTALKIKPDYHEALHNWGIALAGQAQTKTGAEADALFSQAYEKYQTALEIKPDKHEALNNWGVALAGQASGKSSTEADALFSQAYEKYQTALKIKPDGHGILYNWGSALADQARAKSGAEADSLFSQAYEKYQAALKIKPDYHEALHNWGIALADQAQTKTGAEADALFSQAYEKFGHAENLKADTNKVKHNWAIALNDQAKTKSGSHSKKILSEAIKKLEEIDDPLPGVTYDLACAFAQLNDAVKAKHYLSLAEQANTLPSVELIEKDLDLQNLKPSVWFQDLLERMRRKASS